MGTLSLLTSQMRKLGLKNFGIVAYAQKQVMAERFQFGVASSESPRSKHDAVLLAEKRLRT